ncbi:MAG: flagellar basal body-associated FliL family protein [Oleiphilaceae bacterium]|nr:flagellar basal body-associated FliL family protein [Oleiphilaceae bacterium]
MADNDKEQDGTPEEEGKSKKGIIIIALVVLVAIGASVGVTVMLLGGSEPAAESEAVEEEAPQGPAVYHEIKPAFLVTFNVGGRQRYMQVHVSASSRDTNVFAAVEHHMPLIRSKVINLYSGQDFEMIQTEAGKQALREETVRVINEVLEAEGAGLIENVFFTNFVLQ